MRQYKPSEFNTNDNISLTIHGESDSSNGKKDLKPLLTVGLIYIYSLFLLIKSLHTLVQQGTVHPFHKSHATVVGYFHEEFSGLFRSRNVRLATFMIVVNILVYSCMCSWSYSTNSLALKAYSLITLFDALVLSTNILSAWVSRQEYKAKTSFVNTYTLGFERFEVLSVFSCVVIAQIGAVFVVKEALERISDQPEVHAGRLLPGAILALLFHVVANYCVVNHAFRNICEVASSSWVQDHIADMSKGICGIVPLFESLLVPRVNPFFLISLNACCAVLVIDVLLQLDSYYVLDSIVGLYIAVVTIATMWPIATCSGKVLLHSTPQYLLSQLDKILSEARTLDGVLEIKCEKFYTLKVGSKDSNGRKRSPALAGSLQVRVRRDANEQMVLAHVKSRFSNLVPIIAIQVIKDDWTANPHASPMAVNIPMKSMQHGTPKHLSNTYISGFNKPAAAVAPYLQVSPQAEPHKPDFSFSAPSMSANVPSILKTRSSHSDIAKMYKAAGFKLPQSGMQSAKKFGQLESRSSSFTLPK